MRALALAFTTFFTLNLQAQEIIKPKGWLTPTKLLKSGCDRSQSDLYKVIGDFDGNGKLDVAELLTKTNKKKLGLWVQLDSQKKPKLVASTNSKDGQHDQGIALVKPGKYKTLTLPNDAIDFFTCESANRYIYWDQSTKKFAEQWMSD